MNISQYVSLSALGRDIIIIEDLKELMNQLSKAGANLNKLTLLVHQRKVSCIDLASVKKVVESIWQQLNLLTEKTELHLIDSYNCDINNAYNQFVLTKRDYNKETGRQYIHFVQSFALQALILIARIFKK